MSHLPPVVVAKVEVAVTIEVAFVAAVQGHAREVGTHDKGGRDGAERTVEPTWALEFVVSRKLIAPPKGSLPNAVTVPLRT